jgi:hypothetical protein
MDVGIPEIGRSGEDGGDGHDDNLELRRSGTGTVLQVQRPKQETIELSASRMHLGGDNTKQRGIEAYAHSLDCK